MSLRYGARTRVSGQISTWLNPNRLWSPKPVSTWTSHLTVTADASVNVKGAWAQIIASSSADADCVEISVEAADTSATIVGILLDISVGASGSETAIISNVAVGGAAPPVVFGDPSYRFTVPVFVPSGSRVAARIQSNIASRTCRVAVRLSAGPNPSGTSKSTVTLGTSTATSLGTSMANNTSWQEAVASTSNRYEALSLALSNNTATAPANASRQIQFGIGAASSEMALANLDFITSSLEAVLNTFGGLYVSPIPEGSRVAVRYTKAAYDGLAYCLIATETVGL